MATSTAAGPQGPALKIVLPVEGMTCAACQATVQRALTKAPGVEKAAVNLMTNEATVHYDPSTTSPDALVNAINDTGYVARLPRAASAPTAPRFRQPSEARMWLSATPNKALPHSCCQAS